MNTTTEMIVAFAFVFVWCEYSLGHSYRVSAFASAIDSFDVCCCIMWIITWESMIPSQSQTQSLSVNGPKKNHLFYTLPLHLRCNYPKRRLGSPNVEGATGPRREFRTHVSWFPHGLENLEKLENFFQSGKSQGILNRLEKSGNFTQNAGKMREF